MQFLFIGALVLIMTNSSQAGPSANLKIAFPTKQLQLDPQKIEDMYSMTLVNQLYAKLFRYLPDGQVRADLVDQWNISEDKKTYTFTLKKRLFSDHTPIKAIHVANSLKRIFTLKAALSSDLSFIEGAKKYIKTKNVNDIKIQAKDDFNLIIETETPTSLLIHLLAVPDVGVLKVENLDKHVAISASTAFSGPYKIASLTTDKIVLQKWRKSDLESPNPPEEVDFNLFANIKSDQVADGQITDTSSYITFDENKSSLEGNKNWRAVASEAANERFIVMNPDKVPEDIRKWMLSKVNTEDFVKTLDDRSIVPAFGFIPNCLPGHLKKARRLTVESPVLKDKFVITVSHGANLPYANKFRSYLAKVWSHSKIEIKFESLAVSDYLNMLFQKKGQVVIGARGIDYPEGFSVITYFRSNVDSNYFFVNNREIDRLIDLAAQELDSEKRMKIYESIQESVLDEATAIPVAFGSWKKYYWSNRVETVPAHPIGVSFIPLEMLSMAKK